MAAAGDRNSLPRRRVRGRARAGDARVQKTAARAVFQTAKIGPVKPTGKPKRAVCYGLLGSVRER
jgi:hypothetical protein